MNAGKTLDGSSFHSQSESTSGASRSNTLYNQHYYLFQLYDQLFKSHSLPSICNNILVIWMVIQIIFVSLWVPNTNVWFANSVSENFIRYLNCISNFTSLHLSNDEIISRFLVYSALFLISILHVIFQFISLKTRRRLISFSLVSTKLFIVSIPSLLLHPTSLLFGNIFCKCILKNDMEYNFNYTTNRFEKTPVYMYVLLGITFIYLVCFFCLSYFGLHFLAVSVYLPRSFLASFDLQPLIGLFYVSAICGFFANLMPIFPIWSIYFACGLHFGLMIFCFISILRGTMINFLSNVIILGGVSTAGVFDIIRFFTIPFTNPNGTAYMIVMIVIFAICFILSFLWYFLRNKRHQKAITNILNNFNEEFKAESNRQELFDSLGFATNSQKMLEFFDYIISHQIYQFIDFITFKYIISHHETLKALVHVVRIISFFPGMQPYLNIFSNKLKNMNGLDIFVHFLLFELQKIKINRQSSSSVLGAESIKSLSSPEREIESNIKYIWQQTTFNPQILCSLYSRISKLQLLWDEEISSFKNSVAHYKDYKRFLIECKTDYKAAVLQHYKQCLIENGNLFRADICYQKFVENFPAYLKQKILSVNGDFIADPDQNKNKNKSDTGTQTAQNDISFSSGTSQLDGIAEVNMGREIFDNSRLRLALFNSTKDKKATWSYLYIGAILLSVVISIVTSIVLYVWYRNSLDNRGSTTIRIEYSNKIRFYSILSNLALLYDIFQLKENTNYLTDSTLCPLDFDPFVPLNQTWKQLSVLFNKQSRSFYTTFTSNLVELHEDSNLFTYAPQLYAKRTLIPICTIKNNVSTILNYENADLRQSIIFMLYHNSYVHLQNLTFHERLTYDSYFCYVCNSTQFLPSQFNKLTTSMQAEVLKECDEFNTTLSYTKFLVPLISFIPSLLLFLIPLVMYFKEMKKFMKLLLKLPRNVKEKASEPIFTGIQTSSDTIATEASYNMTTLIFPIVFGSLILLIVAILQFVSLNELQYQNTICTYLQSWTTKSRIRKSNVIEMIFWTFVTIIRNYAEDTPINFIELKNTTTAFIEAYEELKYANNMLMSKNDEIEVPLGFSDTLDSYILQDWCDTTTTNYRNSTFHDLYQCSSASQLLSLFGVTMSNIMDEPDHFFIPGNLPPNEELTDIPHLLFSHILPVLSFIDDAFSQLSVDTRESIWRLFDIYLPIEIVLLVVSAAIFFYVKYKMDCFYSVILMMMRRVQPQFLLSDSKIIGYILNKKAVSSKNEMMTIDQSICHSSRDGILFTDTKGIIEVVNPAISNLFGFAPEQLLGHSVLTLFSDNSKESIENQLNLMLHKQTAMTYEGHTNCITDSDQEIACSMTILGISNSNKKDDDQPVDYLVIILRDDSAVLQQQKQVEIAKMQSEILLYQILPRDIVTMINQGEKDVSFSIESASIIFIDIVKFSEYSATLSPQQIMSNLSVVFNSFDTCIKQYNSLIKIKLIGDVYMAAGGIFTPKANPSEHALETARFAMRTLQIMDDINIKLNSMLRVRIGINTGGPLIAGVLGTDKPTFDIIGDPINIAARLQSTDLPGNAQISQSVYELISNSSEFHIEQRGEIMLKGKGKTLTYLMMPLKTESVLDLHLIFTNPQDPIDHNIP